MTVTQGVLLVRVVNRSAGFGMSFLAVRLATGGQMDGEQVGVVLAAFGAATIPSRLLGGAAADRLGNRTAAVVGLVAAGVAQLAIAAAREPAVLIGAVIALGLAYEIVEPATQAAVADNSAADRLAGQFGLLWVALSVAGIISGLLVAILSPLGVPALFLVDGVSSIIAAAVAFTTLPGQQTRAVALPSTGWRDVCTPRLLVWTAIASLYATQVMSAVFMLPVAIRAAGLPSWLPGLVFASSACGGLAYQRVTRRQRPKASPRAVLGAGHVVLALAMALWALGGVVGYLVGAILEGAAGACLVGTYQAHAARLAPAGRTAATLAVFGLCWGIGSTIAPVIAAPLIAGGPPALWLAVGAASLASVGAIPRNPRSATRLEGVGPAVLSQGLGHDPRP
jgi:hypothetical protein